ncbi:MAG: hypothetical protein GXO55_02840 [Chloroflexi bacterium]|nr:hypothetical protein [Chloroflexota bacterium]
MWRWRELLPAFVLGVLTVCVAVALLGFLLVRWMNNSAAEPKRWHPITPTPTSAPTPTPTGAPPTSDVPVIHVGGKAQVVARVGVRLRKSPGYRNKPAGDILVVVPPRSVVEVIGGPQQVDDLRWWRVRWKSYEGWMAEYSAGGTRLLAPR